ncbi:molybdopterin-dependent oxidoreductase [Parasutterella excrementihominis]|uniref:molybdopterin-dependent oxidoreductase n=1 Tax=Parasutterella excrementihominis TaxID=487175 RepID=UPI003A9091EC
MNTAHGGEEGVLKWAELLSGVPAKTIKNLAIAYGKTKPVCIYSAWTAGGAQRTGNGMYYTWLMLALAAMTGNATIRGGGIGSLSPNEGMSVKLGKAPGMAHGKTFKPLLFSTHVSSQVIMTGRDTRTPEQLREDIKLLNGIDLGEDPRLHLEMFIKGAGSGDVFNQRAAINPKLEAWNKLTSVITYDRFMSTTARYSDIIFPVVTHFEESFITGSRVKTDTNFVNQILDPMYECKTDWQINELIAQRLGINWGREGKSDIDVMKIQWAAPRFRKNTRNSILNSNCRPSKKCRRKATFSSLLTRKLLSSTRPDLLRENSRPIPARLTSTLLSLRKEDD